MISVADSLENFGLINLDSEILQTVNAMELAQEALKEIQKRFYIQFPSHPKEAVYGFATPSTMKPTQWSCKVPILHSEHVH